MPKFGLDELRQLVATSPCQSPFLPPSQRFIGPVAPGQVRRLSDGSANIPAIVLVRNVASSTAEVALVDIEYQMATVWDRLLPAQADEPSLVVWPDSTMTVSLEFLVDSPVFRQVPTDLDELPTGIVVCLPGDDVWNYRSARIAEVLWAMATS
jgi:hypothetical protein